MQCRVASRHGRLRYARRTAGIEPSTWHTDNETCNKWKNGNPCRAAKHWNNNLTAEVIVGYFPVNRAEQPPHEAANHCVQLWCNTNSH